jgi:multiple sugar transport system permease protein
VAILVIYLLIVLFPFFWGVLTSLKTNAEIFANRFGIIFAPTLQNFYSAFGPDYNYGRAAENSLIIASGTTVCAIAMASPAAYALARFNFRSRKNIMNWVISLRMMPPIAIVIPIFLMFSSLNLVNTYAGVILAYLTFSLPFAVWLLQGFMVDLPRELEEAAYLDGCSRYSAFRKIILPVSVPGIVVTALFVFLFCWNEFLFAVVLTRGMMNTIPVVVGKAITPYRIEWGAVFVMTILSVLPIFVVFYVLQRHIVRGMTMGAVK